MAILNLLKRHHFHPRPIIGHTLEQVFARFVHKKARRLVIGIYFQHLIEGSGCFRKFSIVELRQSSLEKGLGFGFFTATSGGGTSLVNAFKDTLIRSPKQ